MTFYENPKIGWFLKKTIRKIIFILILCFIIYFLFFLPYFYKKGNTCNKNNCIAKNCIGVNCTDNSYYSCKGNNCKAGDCFGESCKAGDCEGIGCKAGDCYGLNCVPGKCIDPSCQEIDKLNNKCLPFCSNGVAKSIPKLNYHPVIKYLPKDTFLNPNLCKSDKYVYIHYLQKDKILYNFNVDYLNLYKYGKTKYEDAKSKNVSKFISTEPNIKKSNNCEWYAKFNNKKIVSSFKPNYNQYNNNYNWIRDNTYNNPKDENNNDVECLFNDEHKMKINSLEKVSDQIYNLIEKNIPNSDVYIITNNNLKYNNKTNITPNLDKNGDYIISNIGSTFFDIDNIHGEKINLQCNLCQKKSTQYLDVKEPPTNILNKIKYCIYRSYDVVNFTINNIKQNKIVGFRTFTSSKKYYNYANNNKINQTNKNHHIWQYKETINNSQIYTCFWCNLEVKVKYDTLPRKYVNKKYVLDSCSNNNDYNHYMYYNLDNSKNVYLSCLKCNKNAYL